MIAGRSPPPASAPKAPRQARPALAGVVEALDGLHYNRDETRRNEIDAAENRRKAPKKHHVLRTPAGLRTRGAFGHAHGGVDRRVPAATQEGVEGVWRHFPSRKFRDEGQGAEIEFDGPTMTDYVTLL